MNISLSRVHFPVTTLGPGRRLGIWFQGCSIRCDGCISADTWGPGKRPLALAQLLDDIQPWLAEAEGITLSGGEPFDQPDALLALLGALRQRTRVDILVYSGHPLETLQPLLQRAEGLLDALICDPFEQQQAQTRVLRGSDNQRLIFSPSWVGSAWVPTSARCRRTTGLWTLCSMTMAASGWPASLAVTTCCNCATCCTSRVTNSRSAPIPHAAVNRNCHR